MGSKPSSVGQDWQSVDMPYQEDDDGQLLPLATNVLIGKVLPQLTLR